MKRICTVVMLGLLAATTVFAQDAGTDAPAKSQRIERVLIRGNRRIAESTIKSWINIRKGDSYSPEPLDQAVRLLFETGHFVDVKVYVEDGVRRGKIITFEVREKPLIDEIAYEGVDRDIQEEVSEELRTQKIDISEGAEYDPVNVRRAAAVLQNALVRRGNKQAKVIPMVEQKQPTTVSILFKVEE